MSKVLGSASGSVQKWGSSQALGVGVVVSGGLRDFLAVQWFRLLSNAGGMESISGQGAKIPHLGPKHKKNKSNVVTNSVRTLKVVCIKKLNNSGPGQAI